MGSRRHVAIVQAIACAFVVSAPLTAQKRPVTHEDVWTMRRLGSPALSPDGTWVIVSVSEPAYDPDDSVSDLWLVPTDGSAEPRRLTSTKGSEGGVVWSPDGAHVLFTAQRDGDEHRQAYVLTMVGPGEAVRVTEAEHGVDNVQWSPDGKWISYECLVDAAPPAIDKEEDVSASAYETFPVRYWDRWLDDRQVHPFVQPLHEPAAARDLLADTRLIAQEGFSAAPGRGQDSLQSCWTPDGEELLFVATTERHRSAFAEVGYHIYRVTVAGGEPTRLTDASHASESSPRFSPAGDRLFYSRSPNTEHVFNHAHLMARAWPDGETMRVAAQLDRPLGEFAVHDDDVWLLVTEHGRRRVYRDRIGGDAAPRLLDADSRGVYAGIACDRDGDTLVARWEDSTYPAEIVRIDPATGEHTALTSFNRERAAQLDRRPFREFWFDSEAGRRVHCWMVLPPGFDENARYPLITWMHGGPHSSSMDADHVRWSPHLCAAPGYVVIMPDYTGSVGYGEAFAQAIQGDPLRTPGAELLQAAEVAAQRFAFVDASRQAALGASYGGHLANWMQATTTHFKCLVGHAGLVSLEGQWATSDVIHHRERNNGGAPWGDSAIWREQSPSTYAADFVTPMLLTVGERDYRVPLNQTLAAWSYLQRQQVRGRLLVFHKANHWIMRGPDARYFWREVHAWLARHLR